MTLPLNPGPGDGTGRAIRAFDVDRLRAQFPILQRSMRPGGPPLIYLDNGATTHKPRAVIDAVAAFYARDNANIHRGVYHLSQHATRLYEQARERVRRFINAADACECIFTRGTTESINLVAASLGRALLRPGDDVIVSAMEHHSNIVPWQLVCDATGATLRVIPVDDRGELRLDEYEKMLGPRTRIVAVVHLSNALGTINDVARITELAHAVDAKVLIDGAQWVAHRPTDVRAIGCDFYAFSGHKLFGPTGIGVLYGRRELLERMPPYQGGGDMIESVSFEETRFAGLPNRFEAGTPNIVGAIGLAAAIDFVDALDFDALIRHEAALLRHATERLLEIPGLRIVGTARAKADVLSFVLDDPPLATLDIGARLDAAAIAVRTGHHCCMPVMRRFGVAGTVRASFALYNTREEVDALADALHAICTRAAARAKPSARTVTEELRFPEPAASIEAAAQEFSEAFDVLDGWDARYGYLLELGARLPPMPPALKSDATRVLGCQSTVHLFARRCRADPQRMEFIADSDAELVRGLIALLERLFSGQRADAILAFDIAALFTRLGLDDYLTAGRRTGLQSMVERIRAFAAKSAQGGAS